APNTRAQPQRFAIPGGPLPDVLPARPATERFEYRRIDPALLRGRRRGMLANSGACGRAAPLEVGAPRSIPVRSTELLLVRPGDGVHRAHQPAQLERLGDVAVGAEREATRDVCHFGLAR